MPHHTSPVTKYEKMLQKRMENIQNYQAPSSDFTLPSIPEGAIPSFTISLSEGVKFKVRWDAQFHYFLPNEFFNQKRYHDLIKLHDFDTAIALENGVSV